MSNLPPLVITAAGPQPTPPATLYQRLIALVAAAVPGYTANLPGSLIDDVAGTDVGALVICDQARIDLINSLDPYTANPQLLISLGNMLGVPQGLGSNTSVYVVFSGTVGFVIGKGFVVSDGAHQYAVQDGGIVNSTGSSLPLFCLATAAGTWAVPAGTVTSIVTSVPGSITLSVTNPADGLPGVGEQSEEDYRAQVLTANLATSQGMTSYLRTLLSNVSGVQPRLISPLQTSAGWEIIVGGGDPYDVAYEIFTALFDINTLVGSTLFVSNITQAASGKVTTVLNHGLSNGNIVEVNGVVGMTGINGLPLTVTVVDEKNFTTGVDTSGFGAYVSGGIVTPNPRNTAVSIVDYPNTYSIPFVLPPLQTVSMAVTWNTDSPNIVSPAAIAAAAAPALALYVNSILVGQPMNLFVLNSTFQQAVANIVDPQLLTRLVFSVSINGVGTAPEAGTGIIAGDPESFFQTASDGSQIVISQG